MHSQFGSVAQLNRVLDYGSSGSRFESWRSHESTGCSAVRLAHLVWDQRVPGSNPGTPTKKTTFELSSFFCRVTRLRSACCASADLSASCCECAELLRNNDNRLNSGISNKFACRYSIYHLNLRFSAHSFTSWSALGFCRRSNFVVGAQVY